MYLQISITNSQMEAKGKLVIIGGAVDKGTPNEEIAYSKSSNLNFFSLGILRRIINEAKNGKSKVAVVTTASNIPEEIGIEYTKAFNKLDVKDVEILHIKTRDDANDVKYVDIANEADIVMFTGGDQLRLTSIVGGTDFIDAVRKRYSEGNFLLAGTSAGAMACSETMIYHGSSSEALLKGAVKLTSGFGFVNDIIIDTHFVKRGRIGRLFQAVAANPSVLGIGLGEDTGLLIKNNGYLEAIGSGLVIIVDGKHIKDTNIASIPDGTPISVSNFIVHVMSMHDLFHLQTRTISITHRAGVKNLNRDI